MSILEDLQSWQAAKGSRSVEIKIQTNLNFLRPEMKIWVYDATLKVGQYIETVADIDLEKLNEAAEKKMLEELSKKYGGRG